MSKYWINNYRILKKVALTVLLCIQRCTGTLRRTTHKSRCCDTDIPLNSFVHICLPDMADHTLYPVHGDDKRGIHTASVMWEAWTPQISVNMPVSHCDQSFVASKSDRTDFYLNLSLHLLNFKSWQLACHVLLLLGLCVCVCVPLAFVFFWYYRAFFTPD